MLAPIVVFAYKRPECLRATLQALSENPLAKQSKLVIFVDGPKGKIDFPDVSATISVANDPEWIAGFETVEVCPSKKNKGLAESVISGVSRVIAEFGRVIVVEDDLLVSMDFLQYMNDCLDYYEGEERISSIGAFSPIVSKVECKNNIFKSKMGCSTGWATWGSRWNNIIWDKEYYVNMLNVNFLNRFESVQYGLAKIFQNYIAGVTDTWAIRWDVNNILAERYTVYPLQSKVQNIGFGEGASNSVNCFDKQADIRRQESTFLCLPFEELCDLSETQRRDYKPSIMERTLDFFDKLFHHN